MEDNNQGSEAVSEEIVAPELDDSSELSEGQDNIPEETPAAIKKELRKLKLKVDGQEFEESFDPDDNEYMTRQFQLAKMSQKRAQEAAQLKKEVTDWVEQLRKNPRKVLSDPNLGVDLKKIAAELIEEELANSQKSPEQIEKEKLVQELKELKEAQKREKEESEKQNYERMVNENIERYDASITDALEKVKLPSTPYSIKKMTEYMMFGIENGIDVSPYEVADLVKEEMQADIKQMFQVLPEDIVEQLIGKETINKIRKKNLAKAKSKPPVPMNSSIKDTGKSGEVKETAGEKKSYKEFFGI